MAESLQAEVSLPTLERLGAKLPENIDPRQVADTWLQAFSKAIQSTDIDAVVQLFLEDALWRDMLALTWTFRTFHGVSRIRKLLHARLAETRLTTISLGEDRDREPTLFDSVPGLVWVQGFFDFETAVGVGSGVFRVVPTSSGKWKAHVVYTNLESLHGVPARVGHLRNHEPNHGQWQDQRAKEQAFENADPKVLIVGGGQSGLDVAARLKYWDVPSLVVEKNARIGDNWRNRYQALCLHDPVWYDHMPYLNFPPTWPVYAPAPKLADWLESYAHSLELNVWTSTLAESVERDESKNVWVVTLIKPDGSKRIMRPNHIVFALGLAGNQPKMPNFPGMSDFQGEFMHSTQYHSAADYVGKKAVVVGACTSAHDIAQDFQYHGVDVTLVQRSPTCIVSVKRATPLFFAGFYEEGGPLVDVADRLNASYPIHLLKLMHQEIVMKKAMEVDRDLTQALERVGFSTTNGEDDSGWLMMAFQRGGGYYLDVGASQLIIDGKIKLKRGSVKSLEKEAIVFEDGSKLEADVIVFATGYGDTRDAARKIIGDKLTERIPPVWGLTHEGEIRSVWRDCGLPNLYIMMGNLALCRFHSTHIALQIKAKEKCLPISPYVD